MIPCVTYCQSDATSVMKVKGTDALTAHELEGVNIRVNRSYHLTELRVLWF